MLCTEGLVVFGGGQLVKILVPTAEEHRVDVFSQIREGQRGGSLENTVWSRLNSSLP